MGMTDLRDDAKRVLAKNNGTPSATAGETKPEKSWWQIWK
jgi:hypothetical protein